MLDRPKRKSATAIGTYAKRRRLPVDEGEEEDKDAVSTRTRHRHNSAPCLASSFTGVAIPLDGGQRGLRMTLPTSDEEEASEVEEEVIVANRRRGLMLGHLRMTALYTSPYPLDGGDTIHLCSRCLQYFSTARHLVRHTSRCLLPTPPGTEIYRDAASRLRVFEVGGEGEAVYAQNLCLLGQLFIESKAMHHHVEQFNFYVLCRAIDGDDAQFVGYFSRSSSREHDENLSCVMTLPRYRGNGYGGFLIDLSYKLTQGMSTTGTPERPFSESGEAAYTSYWRRTILGELHRSRSCRTSIDDIAQRTGIGHRDVVCTLHAMHMLRPGDGYVSSSPSSSIDRSFDLVVNESSVSAFLAECPLDRPSVNVNLLRIVAK